MTTLSTAVKPISAFAKAAALVVGLLLSTLTAKQAKADDVLIFYNADKSNSVSHHDGALITRNSELLAKHIKSINPDLNVVLHPIYRLDEASRILKDHQEKVRGVAFVGHGNPNVFALNSAEITTGYGMASLVSALPVEKLSGRFTVYFLGCELAKKAEHGKVNFQMAFLSDYLSRFPVWKRPSIEVIAHTSMSAFKSFQKPNAVHAASYKSGFGRWSENLTLKKGMILPNIAAFMGTPALAAVAGMDQTSIAHIGAATLAAILAKAYVDTGISRYGTTLTPKGEVENSIANLLQVSFQADQCQAVFKLRSL